MLYVLQGFSRNCYLVPVSLFVLTMHGYCLKIVRSQPFVKFGFFMEEFVYRMDFLTNEQFTTDTRPCKLHLCSMNIFVNFNNNVVR